MLERKAEAYVRAQLIIRGGSGSDHISAIETKMQKKRGDMHVDLQRALKNYPGPTNCRKKGGTTASLPNSIAAF